MKYKLLTEILESLPEHKRAYGFIDANLEEVWVNWGEVRSRAQKLSGWLQKELPQGAPVILLFEPSLEFIISYIACSYSGNPAIPVPVPKTLAQGVPPENIARIVTVSGAKGLLTSDLLAPALPLFNGMFAKMKLEMRCITVREASAFDHAFTSRSLKPSDLALIQFTSGSTGTPSGVMLTHQNLSYMLQVMDRTVIRKSELGLCWLPHTHNTGLLSILGAIGSNFPILIMSPLTFVTKPVLWLKAMAQSKASISGAPNFAWDLCVKMISKEESEGIDLSHWKTAYSGGEALSQRTFHAFAERFKDNGFSSDAFLPLYGMSEATLLITANNRGALPSVETLNGRAVVNCGKAIEGLDLRIVDPENHAELSEGQVGEIWAAGPGISTGYIGDSTKTASAFGLKLEDHAGAYLRTGDLGMIKGEELYIVGRIKEIFILQGRKFHATDIETSIKEAVPQLALAPFLLVAIKEGSRESLHLLIELPDAAIPLIEAAAPMLAKLLSQKHDVPMGDVWVLAPLGLPRTDSSKLQRFKAQELAQADQLPHIKRIRPGATKSVATPKELSPSSVSLDSIEGEICLLLSKELEVASVDRQQPFVELGISSLSVYTLSAELEKVFKLKFAPTIFYDYPNVEELATYIRGELLPHEQQKTQRNIISAATDNAHEDIAIVGYACRLPGADNAFDFWHNLKDGICSIGEIPKERWNKDEHYQPLPAGPGKMYSTRGGFLKQSIKMFDSEHFGITPIEAARIDPQQRLILELAWEAMDHSGTHPQQWRGSLTGVWMGISSSDYTNLQLKEGIAPNRFSALGGAHSIAANRVSYTFDLQGPSLAIDTACSSSLVSLHMACDSLRRGECNAAVVGGVNLILTPDLNIVFSEAQMLSPDGLCKSFDDEANGYVRSEGAVVLIVKRLVDAKAAGDVIHAVIKGSAVNQDGASNGITAPNRKAQVAVIRQAYAQARMRPDEVQMIETHGTGTKLGDPIEYAALLEAMGDTPLKRPLVIGSVKSNIGHLEAAAGLAGLLKLVLSLKAGIMPGSLHFKTINKQIGTVREDRLTIGAKTQTWERPIGGRRAASISSFGFGGTNVHMVLMEREDDSGEERSESASSQSSHVLRVSSHSLKALEQNLKIVGHWVENNPQVPLAVVAEALQSGRAELKFRAVCVIRSPSSASPREALSREIYRFLEKPLVENSMSSKKAGQPYSIISGKATRVPPKLMFVFSGQGTGVPSGAAWLYAKNHVFRETIDQGVALMKPELGRVIKSLLLEGSRDVPSTDVFQPLTYLFQIASLRWLASLGIEPSSVAGHSLGELAAATAAGSLRFEDGILLATVRGQCMQATKPGKMIALMGSGEGVSDLVSSTLASDASHELSIAAVNSPKVTIVSGSEGAIDQLSVTAQEAGYRIRPLPVERAFHSALMDPFLESFEDTLKPLPMLPLQKTFYSTVSGKATPQLNARYWRDQVRMPTLFQAAMESAIADENRAIIEIGPDNTLSGLITSFGTAIDFCVPLFEKGVDSEDSVAFMLGTLWARGWTFPDRAGEKSSEAKVLKDALSKMPPYLYDRKLCWIHGNERKALKIETPSHIHHQHQFTREVPMSSASNILPLISEDIVLKQIRVDVCALLGLDESNFDVTVPLIELGADSLVMMDALSKLEDRFGVAVPINRLFGDLSSARLIAQFIASHSPAAHVAADRNAAQAIASHYRPASHSEAMQQAVGDSAQHLAVSQNYAVGSLSGDGVDGREIIQEQLRLMNIQMEFLLRSAGKSASVQAPSSYPSPSPSAGAALPSVASVTPLRSEPSLAKLDASMTEANRPRDRFDAFAPDRSKEVVALDAKKKAHLDGLTKNFSERTLKSKQYSAKYRLPFADNRSSSGFRLPLKEMIYPIVMERSLGANFWDIDGNKYSDFTMGFGVNLFGHNDPDILKAIGDQLTLGIAVGPQSAIAGEVAERLTRMVGMERAVFTNSGTEAVMTAVRLARTATGRQKLVIFTNSYHGTFDGILGRSKSGDPRRTGTPVAPGIPGTLVQDLVVLDYGTPEALAYIKEHGSSLAAVMVEPVQSRHPENHFGDFLKALRELTTQSGTALIFDEVITGFRTGPGGAQEYFGVEADLATYGKVLGGGLPIGAIAGKARFVDPIDGGVWTYGDDSVPEKELTFFAGTFCKHPLAMAAARATLIKLENAKGAIQRDLSAKVKGLVDRMNEWFEAEGLSIKLVSFGSLFRFLFTGNYDLLFYHLVSKGIYIWEGRNLFLSTAHTEADIALFESATREALLQLREAGFIGGTAPAKK